MPWKLIVFLFFVGLILAFVGFNAANVSDVSFGFYQFEDVPIFLSLFAAFFLGVLVTLPFTFRPRSTRARKRPKREMEADDLRNENTREQTDT
ncbi:MAG: hypothetical protein ACLFNX_00555 [Spirochaetaceae bacterium]